MAAAPADMPILTTIRQSPAYLYVKTYCLCAIITLFQAAPVSSRIPHIPHIRDVPHFNARRILTAPPTPRIVSTHLRELPSQLQTAKDRVNIPDVASSHPGPSSALTKECPPERILGRWIRRAVDLTQIKKLMRYDEKDLRTYPELGWDANVRRSSAIHPEEQRFIQLRQLRISSQGANSLHAFLDLPENEQVDPRDAPLIALGGSGGGYRAMYGFTAFISTSKKLGLWDCLTWTAAVSGSCWTLAAYYTIAKHDPSRLIRHYLSTAKELAHPMSLHAFDTVVRSRNGVYFLIGPLLRKVRSGIIGLGIMDLYGTLTTTYQFLSRGPKGRLSRATFQFSKVWTRSGIDRGMEPMPILTAVRRAPKDSSGVKPHTDSSISKGRPPNRALTQHQTKVPDVIAGLHLQKPQNDKNLKPIIAQDFSTSEVPDSSLAKGFFQWFEISPLEVGSPDINGYIPTWSWGRSFVSGRSVGRSPEQSLALLLGQCTSAPAGPLTGYISALLASLPKGTIMSHLLLLLNDFVRMKKWERLWGNPIRAGHDPNPFFGHNNWTHAGKSTDMSVQPVVQTSTVEGLALLHTPNAPLPPVEIGELRNKRPMKRVERGNMFHSSSFVRSSASRPDLDSSGKDDKISAPLPLAKPTKWESEGRIRLMDSGMSNNLPNHVLARPERSADVLIAFDASSDVQTGSAIKRIQNFADDCHLELEDQTALFDLPEPRFHTSEDGTGGDSTEVECKFLRKYARVFRATRENGQEIYLIYCPLLPNGSNPGFNPSVSADSSFNVDEWRQREK